MVGLPMLLFHDALLDKAPHHHGRKGGIMVVIIPCTSSSLTHIPGRQHSHLDLITPLHTKQRTLPSHSSFPCTQARPHTYTLPHPHLWQCYFDLALTPLSHFLFPLILPNTPTPTFGSATLTSQRLPSMTCSAASALRAEAGSTNWTKPKPRLLALNRSFMTSAASTTPNWLK